MFLYECFTIWFCWSKLTFPCDLKVKCHIRFFEINYRYFFLYTYTQLWSHCGHRQRRCKVPESPQNRHCTWTPRLERRQDLSPHLCAAYNKWNIHVNTRTHTEKQEHKSSHYTLWEDKLWKLPKMQLIDKPKAYEVWYIKPDKKFPFSFWSVVSVVLNTPVFSEQFGTGDVKDSDDAWAETTREDLLTGMEGHGAGTFLWHKIIQLGTGDTTDIQ